MRPLRLPAAVAMFAGINLIPLVGVVAFGWNTGEIVLLYWYETGVVLAVALVRFLRMKHGVLLALMVGVVSALFMFAHLTLVGGLFFEESSALLYPALRRVLVEGWFVLVSVGVTQVLASQPWKRGEDPSKEQRVALAFGPFGRIMLLQFVLLFGGFFALLVGHVWPILVMLLAIHGYMDYYAYAKPRGLPTPITASVGVQPKDKAVRD